MFILLNFGTQNYRFLIMIQNISTTKSIFIAVLTVLMFQKEAFSQTNFFNGSYSELQEKAKSEKKIYFVDFYTGWCGFCKKMDATTFQHKELGEYIDQHFIAYKLNAEEGVGKTLSQENGVKGFPTVLVFDSKGKVIDRIVGYKAATEFKAALQKHESKSTSNNTNSEALQTYNSFVAQDYTDLKEKAYNSSMDQFAPLKEQCIALGKNNKRFDFEELQFETEQKYGLEKAKELNLYYMLGKGDIESIKKEVTFQRENNYLTTASLPYFILHFVMELKPDMDVLKWTNEYNNHQKSKESLELKTYIQLVVGDSKDASDSFNELKKEYYKKESTKRIDMLELIIAK